LGPGRAPALLAALAALAGILVLAGSALAAGRADPAAAMLARSLKAQMQKSYAAKVPGIRFTKVTCTLTKNHEKGSCRARFTLARQRVKGVYKIAITVDTRTGGVHSRATSVSCTDSKTGTKVGC
jgi:hypothetical protein